MSTETQHSADEPTSVEMTLGAFFEKTPPGRLEMVRVKASRTVPGGTCIELAYPQISLWCETCDGLRNASTVESDKINSLERVLNSFVTYRCNNCGGRLKTYALAMAAKGWDRLEIAKLGEMPAFGPPTPKALLKLAGSERDYFFKGLRAENQSLGIAAFAYYRRVVEAKKDYIFDQIARVAEVLGADATLIDELQAAKKETQFKKAVEQMKHGIPQNLYISGHNPLTLLHAALSDGIHNRSDGECLALATSIRVVLTEFLERIELALKDDKELVAAVKALVERR